MTHFKLNLTIKDFLKGHKKQNMEGGIIDSLYELISNQQSIR